MDVYVQEREFFRLVADIYLSEDGAYKELPDDIAAAYIKAEVVYVIVSMSPAGHLRVQSFANPPVMDKGRAVGGPVTYDGATLYTEPGAGGTALPLRRVDSPYLSTSQKALATAMFAKLSDATDGKWYA